ncbi:unnamed protein product [Brachionus calyciflorus]|uniref:Pyridoxal-dependent decarboxylase domain-containing protein 1 n=1 Tax=Brachionus calyciflorus TaxID=104777 RepID=A0A813M5S5_9BILA|nr:unnamed protein product [Brachionus calyciflorus]
MEGIKGAWEMLWVNQPYFLVEDIEGYLLICYIAYENEMDEEKSKLIDYVQDNNPNLEVSTKKESPGAADQRQMNNFLGPMLKEMEDAVAEQMKFLDKMEEDLMSEDRKEQYNRMLSHIPQEIRERKSIQTIFKNLEKLIYDNDERPKEELEPEQIEKNIQEYLSEKEVNNKTDKPVDVAKTEELNYLACMSSNLSAFLLAKNPKKNLEKLKVLTVKFYDAVNLWISRLFRFNNSSILFYDDEADGLIRVCNMVLNYKYKDYQKNGYESIKNKPVIYISASSKYAKQEFRELITTQLGLPLSTIKVLDVSKELDITMDKIDVQKFEEQIESDLKEDMIPVALVANVGTSKLGQCDNLKELNRICYKNRIWVHLEGVYLSTLAMYSVPTVIQPVWSGDSITLDLATWLGIPSLSYVTLYRNVDNSAFYLQPFNSFKTIIQRCLPYWSVLQALGHEGVIERIKYANEMSIRVGNIIFEQKPYLKILILKDTGPQEQSKIKYSISDLLAKALGFLTYVDLNNPVIIFKCDPEYVKERLFLTDIKSEKIENSKLQPHQIDFLNFYRGEQVNNLNENVEVFSPEILEYTDTLTSWLFELLTNNNSKLEFELVEIENEGLCIRYCAFEHVNINETNFDDIIKFSKSVNELMNILDASIRCKTKFEREVRAFKNLLPVNVPKWAGVGAVRYIPEYLIDQIEAIKEFFRKKSELQVSKVEENEDDKVEENKNNETSEDQKLQDFANEINELNEQIVKKLQSQDSAFSSDLATDNLIAIKFGMIQDLDSLKRLFEEVLKVSKEVEESSKFIEKMTDLIKHGIEKANEDLKKENEQKINQEGILRHIPLVGGLFSWISPSPTVNMVGRTFNLQSGKIMPTETTYKYHVQVEEASEKDLPQISLPPIERELSNDTVKLNDSNEVSELETEQNELSEQN